MTETDKPKQYPVVINDFIHKLDRLNIPISPSARNEIRDWVNDIATPLSRQVRIDSTEMILDNWLEPRDAELAASAVVDYLEGLKNG